MEATNYKDNFIAKYSTKGKLLWIKHIEADTKNKKTFIICYDNKLYYAGSYFNTINLGSYTFISESDADIFISEINTDGEFINAISFGGFNSDILNDIVCTQEGDVYLTGEFENKLNFAGQKLISNGKTDIFLAKLTGLIPNTIKQFGTYYTDYGKKLFIYKDKVLLAGSFSDNINFENINLVSAGVLDSYIASFDKDCNIQWAKSIGGQANDYAHSFAVSTKGNIYLTGNFRGEIIGKNQTVEADSFRSDIFIAKYNIKGEQIWLKNYGAYDYDYPVDMIADKNDYIYQTGNFGKDFKLDDIKATNTKGGDIYTARFYDCENSVPLQLGKDSILCAESYILEAPKNYKNYLWSNGTKENNLEIYASGNYTLTITDEFGCEFTDTINITLSPLPEINLPEEITFNPNEQVILDAGEGFETYLWNTDSREQKIIVNEEDIYGITVTNKIGCTNYAEVFVKEKSNIAENTKTKLASDNLKLNANSLSLDIYPNPSNGKFVISLDNINTNTKTILEIYTPNGQLIKQMQLSPSNKYFSKKITLQSISAGSYVLKVWNGDVALVGKFEVVK